MIGSRYKLSSGLWMPPGDEHDHHPGFHGELGAGFLSVELDVVQAENERGQEEQGHGDSRPSLFRSSSRHEVDQHENEQQPLDLGDGAREPLQLVLLDRQANIWS
jgi:hypothetical protein